MHIELIATDGTIQKRVLWVDVTSNGVYSGFCDRLSDCHISYHFDGNVFQNWRGKKPEKVTTLPRIEDFKGWRQLVCSGFSSDLSRLHGTRLYSFKRLDAIVSVDTRVYERGVGCMLFMIEPNRYDLLGLEFAQSLQMVIREIHSFLECVPWISLAIYGDAIRNETPKE